MLTEPAEGFVARVDAARERLAGLAAMAAPAGLTEPDPPTGERWDWGQVWAHLAEFVPFWSKEIRSVAGAEGTGPVPFGRVKGDPGRVGAIEADRHTPPGELFDRLSGQLDDLKALLGGLSPESWERSGVHQTLGVMPMPRMVEEFVVGHLEQHAEQLEGLLA